ncbi:MAG: FtsX-like permease family protein [Oscillospiraceae bacterium]|nr:FtsX-like permease family protein [Oscillospiraceae bacterium]
MLLLKKAARTVWRAKKSYISCVALMSIGIMMYVSFNILYLNLVTAMDTMYEEQRFGDGFAQVVSMPQSSLAVIEAIPGVEQVSGVLRVDARVDAPGAGNIVTLRLISYDPADEYRLNDIYLEAGTAPSAEEIAVNTSFAATHGFELGDPIDLIVSGRRVSPLLSGMALSPEYVYAIQDLTELLPDPETFGVGFMPLQQLAALTGRGGEVNALSFRMSDGVEWSAVEFQLEDALSSYGLVYLLPREDQLSHAMLDMQLASIGGMATSVPLLFVMMAVVILYILLKRVIEQERGQIGILKAFGFTDRQLLAHYLCYGLITGVLGALFGITSGLAVSGVYTDLMAEFFSLPSLRADVSPQYLLVATAISLGSGAFGAIAGARAMIKLSPSDAMRPPAPPAVKGDPVGAIPGLRHLLSSYGYMALRSISRNKFRSAFVALGISFSFAIIAFMAGYMDMYDDLLFDRFTKSELFDLRITMASPVAYTSLVESVHRLNGVDEAEAILELPVQLSHKHLSTGVMLTAIREDSELYRIYDSALRVHLPPSRGGVILSSSVADSLRAQRGSMLLMSAPSAGQEDIWIPVLDVVTVNIGGAAYIELTSLWELLGIPPTATSAIVRTGDSLAIIDMLRYNESISSLTDQARAQEVLGVMLETNGAMFVLMQIAGIGIAWAIITASSSISLSERKREYATLRVLGMQPKEVAEIMGFEYWVLSIIGMLAGIPLVYLMKVSLNDMMGTDLFTIPLYTPMSAYIQAALLCALAVLISNLSARRRIATFGMVDVLKERDYAV